MTRWRETSIRTRAAGLRASPYYEWAAASGFAYYGATPWMPVLLGLRETTAQQFAAQALEMQKRKRHEQGWAAQVRVPAFYAARPERLGKPIRFLALLATRDFLSSIYRGGDPAGLIECFEIGRAMKVLEEAELHPPEPKFSGKPGRPEVVSAVIDDGVAFAHDRFWDAPGATRIEYVWDQLEPATEMTGTWGYGRQIDKRDPAEGIDRKLQDSRQAGLVDEDKFYRLMKQADHSLPGHKSLSLRAAHGAHVMDIACNWLGRPQPGTRPIVAVQLPTATTADTSGATLAPQIYNGLCYIMDRASAIAANAGTGQLPVVVNVSYGIIAGPHDGSSPLEQAMDELLDSANPVDADGNPKAPPFRVVLPAGNNFLSRCHAKFSLPKGKARELHWRVLPDDWTESYVEIWMPDTDGSGNPASLAVTITAPDGTSSGAFSAGVVQELLVDGGLVGWAAYYPPGGAGRRALLRLSLAPTGWPDGGLNLTPAGLYRLMIENTGKAEVKDIHAWIQRDDTPLGYARRGRQSYFDDPKYERFDNGGRLIESDPVPPPGVEDSYVKRDGALNAIATGKHPIVVGGLRRSDWKPAAYTGSGPVVLPPGRGNPCNEGPDALTISEDTPSHRGVLAAGSRSGSRVAMHGTSVAAPQIARWVADELAAKRPGDRQAVADYTKRVLPPPLSPPLYTERTRPPGAAPQPPKERGGEGRVEFPAPGPARAERR